MKIKFLLLLTCLATAAVAGANPADYDPFFDNTHDTYHLIAAAIPFSIPQEDDREFSTPTPGPNAQACKAVWDKGVPCPVDGKFYGYWGELQPEYCDHDFFQKDGKTQKPDAEKCHCNIAMTTDQKDCPVDKDGNPEPMIVVGSTCAVYCREKDHCHCVRVCDMNGDAGEPGPSPKPKSANKKGAK